MRNKGYYDLLLSLKEQVSQDALVKNIIQEQNNISDINQYLLAQFSDIILNQLKTISDLNDKIAFLNQLLDNFTSNHFSKDILLQIESQENKYQSKIRLTDNHLFTNDNEQELIEQLIYEMTSCDQVLFVYPFISKSMINKLRNAFNYAFKHKIPINIITTTFDDQALFVNLYELEQLIKKYSNVTIKIEDNSQKRSERIHIKAAIFLRNSGFSSAIVGSSNLTLKGMQTGREWNIKINQFNNSSLYNKILNQYYHLWDDNLLAFNDNDIRSDLFKRIKNQKLVANENHLTFTSYLLYDFQIDILNKLQFRRKINKNKHLIVMATGTGKTIISAFDYWNKIKANNGHRPKILFLAHQKEIVEQALNTFRNVLKDNQFAALFKGIEKNFHENYLFATIQTIHRHLKQFNRQQFDLIIFDEAHHIAAKTFDQVFNYFQPQEIIGLTATPEREDNKSILSYFDHEFAYELRLWDAINQRLLSKFDYYCIDDINSNLTNVDLNNDQQVFNKLNTVARNQLLLDVIKNYIGFYHEPVALIFCINTSHAEIVANYLQAEGLKAAYLTNKVTHLRSKIINDFKKRKINYLCVVNIFNEGIDVPEIDTIILLRPTSSKTVYLQQLGRGLRKVNNKNQLSVFDLIANIDKKYDITLGIKNLYHNQALLNPKNFNHNLGYSLPNGCTITLENKSREIILKNLQQWYQATNRMHQVVRDYYNKYQEQGLLKILEDYDLNLILFYNSLNDLYFNIVNKNLVTIINSNNSKRNKNLLKQFLFLNDYEIINYFYLRLKNDNHNLKINYHFDNLLICSLFYEVTSLNVFRKYFSDNDEDIVIKFINENCLIVKELLIILKYKLDNEQLVVNNHKIKNYPLLAAHATFTVRQALCTIHRVNFIKQLGPLKIIAFQAGYLTFDNTKSVVFADISAAKYGKKTNYNSQESLFYWSIPETKGLNSKLVHDLENNEITKFLFLNNTINTAYPNLNLKLYRFIGIGEYQATLKEKFITIKFKIKDKIGTK